MTPTSKKEHISSAHTLTCTTLRVLSVHNVLRIFHIITTVALAPPQGSRGDQTSAKKIKTRKAQACIKLDIYWKNETVSPLQNIGHTEISAMLCVRSILQWKGLLCWNDNGFGNSVLFSSCWRLDKRGIHLQGVLPHYAEDAYVCPQMLTVLYISFCFFFH